MSERWGRIIGTFTVVLCVVAFVIGLALLGKSYTMTAHVDEARANVLTDIYASAHFQMSSEERARREREIVGLRTAKWPMYNVGVCFCLVAATFAAAIFRFRLWDIRNLNAATTPVTRWRLIGLTGAAWLALIPAFVLGLHDDYAQDDLTPYDGYGPGAGTGLFLVAIVPWIITIWIVAVLVCRFVVLRKANLPATLWGLDYRRSFRSARLNLFYGTMTSLLVALVVMSTVYFKWAIPSGLVGIYVMLSSRAGLLSRKAGRS